MMRSLVIALLAILSCSFSRGEMDIDARVSQIEGRFLHYAEKKYKVRTYGVGGGTMDEVERFNVAFEGNQKLNVDQVRRLYVHLVEDYLQRINEDKILRPYLHNYPFTIQDIRVSLRFMDKHDDYIDRNYVARVAYADNKKLLFYSAHDPLVGFIDLHQESYEDALRIVREEESAGGEL